MPIGINAKKSVLYIDRVLCSNLKTLVNGFFATNAKMVLINDDQCNIADIMLGVWLKVKKLNHPSNHPVDYESSELQYLYTL